MGTRELTSEQKKKIYMCYNAAVKKKAEEILVLDIRGVSTIADFFVICHGASERQVRAISDGVEEAVYENGFKVGHTEGEDHGQWILMDIQDIVLHVFHKTARVFYSLDRLWADARRIGETEILAWEVG